MVRVCGFDVVTFDAIYTTACCLTSSLHTRLDRDVSMPDDVGTGVCSITGMTFYTGDSLLDGIPWNLHAVMQ